MQRRFMMIALFGVLVVVGGLYYGGRTRHVVPEDLYDIVPGLWEVYDILSARLADTSVTDVPAALRGPFARSHYYCLAIEDGDGALRNRSRGERLHVSTDSHAWRNKKATPDRVAGYCFFLRGDEERVAVITFDRSTYDMPVKEFRRLMSSEPSGGFWPPESK